ncbi:hypothetical protein [Blastococcus sp. SYSU DS1024]
MTGLLVAAAVWPVLVVPLAFLIGRLLRSTDRLEEAQRAADATAAAPPVRRGARSRARRSRAGRGRLSPSLGAHGS